MTTLRQPPRPLQPSRRRALQKTVLGAVTLANPWLLQPAGAQKLELGKSATDDALQAGPINVTLTGLAVNGGYRVLIEAISSILRDTYPGSTITVKPSSPAGGLQMVADKKADITFASGTPELRAALDGTYPFKAPLPRNFAWLMYVHRGLVFFFVANKKWADQYGIRSIGDLAIKKPPVRVGNNRHGNLTVVVITEEVFKVNGFSSADIDRWGGSSTWVPGPEAVDQLADGKIDFLANANFVHWAALSKLASSRELVWLDTPREKLQQVADKWEYEVGTIPRGSFNFITEDKPTINEWINAVVGLHVPDATVIKVLRALSDHADRIRALHPAFGEFTPQKMALKSTRLIPYHPAAERFYRSHGLIA